MSKSAQKKTKPGRKPSAAKKTAPEKKPAGEKRPFRREIWSLVLFALALFVAVSYFDREAIFIGWFAGVLTGLLGYGYWLTAPALLLAAVVLLFHHGRPVRLRVACALLLPLIGGALCHMILVTPAASENVLKDLWITGGQVTSGGVIAGGIAALLVRMFSKVASVIIFVILFLVCGMVVSRITPAQIWERYRSRPRYEEEPEPEAEPAAPAAPRGPVRSPIDIPLDGEPAVRNKPAEEKKPGVLTGFFRHKAAEQKTPDQLLKEPEEAPAKPARKSAPRHEEPPVPAPVMWDEPVEEPEELVQPPAAETPESRKETARQVAQATAEVTSAIEEKLAEEEPVYQFPPLSLLESNTGGNYAEAGAELRNNSRRLAETLASFGVDATPGDVIRGPSVTRYEFTLDQGVKLSKITNLAVDIALALGASGVRIAPIPDKISVVGIEVPNKQVTPVLIRDVLESREFTGHRSTVAFAVGKDIGGSNIVGNISRLPHVLIAGTTGSGKSVCTNSLIVSLLYKSSPEDVRFIMVDPKMVELAPYNGIPHLLIPVVTDPKKAAGALQWAVYEMMKRYRIFSENNVKDLAGYNALAATRDDMEHLPSVVVVIDELADLMLVAAKEVEESICRVAQMGRAAGMHLVIATQRPSTDVITGLMKANIPSRIAFAVASSLESRIILDVQGAEKLVGKGDMLYAPLGESKRRVQGCFITPEEIERVVAFVKEGGEAKYSEEVMQKIEESVAEKEKGSAKGGAAPAAAEPASEFDELLPAAVEVVLETGQASVSMLQRRLKLGYSRAARLVDQMEERGIVGPFEGSKPRQLLISRERWQELQMAGGLDADLTQPPSAAGEELAGQESF